MNSLECSPWAFIDTPCLASPPKKEHMLSIQEIEMTVWRVKTLSSEAISFTQASHY